MRKLKIILQHDYIFYISFILVIILSLLRISTKGESCYTEHTISEIGIVKNILVESDKTTITLSAYEDLIVYYYGDNKFILGDRIKVEGEFRRIRENTTKYLFNYQRYQEERNIYYYVISKKITKINHNNSIYYKIKNFIINRLNNRYLYAFILGDKSYIDDDVIRSYQENGISHLFAISGMHIAIFANIINRLLNRLSKIYKYIITCFFLLIYLFLLGLSPSIVRGILFYFLFNLNKLLNLKVKSLNIYILVLNVTLLINPNYIFDIAFQYSFFISLMLIKHSNKITGNYLIKLFKISVISFISSIPISLYNFYQINLLSIFLNLFYVPLVSILIFPLSLIKFIIPNINIVYNILIIILEKTSLFFSNIDIFKFTFKRLPFFLYLIYVGLILLYFFIDKKKYLYFLLFLLFIHYMIPYFDMSDYIKVIDVGQGDSILIHSNNKNILIDTGGSYSSEGSIYYNTLLPLFKSEGIKKLDILIITHGDSDHIGDAKILLNNFKVNKVILNLGYINDAEKDIVDNRTIIGEEGLNIKLGNIQLVQLNTSFDDENDSSQIYLAYCNSLKILLMGDASKKSESVLLNKYELSDVDILKVGHHGSKTSTSYEFLKKIRPRYALISSGRYNRFNHPHKEVIDRLKSFNIKIYNTKNNGTITINLNNKSIIPTIS